VDGQRHSSADGVRPDGGETRKQDHELPQRMIVKYIDVDRDFQIGAQQATPVPPRAGAAATDGPAARVPNG
jgi:hypothetical protein